MTILRVAFRAAVVFLIASIAPGLSLGQTDQDEAERLEGSLELIYRNVDVSGSDRKYDEDFDGQDSGARLSNLSANWLSTKDGGVDYARLSLSGLGGEPHERSALRLGRKNSWELRLDHTKQDYRYNLFELVSNEDGALWDSERRDTNISLSIRPKSDLRLWFGFRERRRTGDSLFMKDIQRDLFRLETPLDQTSQHFTVGVDYSVGPVDFVVRQTLRDYDNNFDNRTEGDQGVDLTNTSALDHYEWLQRDNGDADWTTLSIHTPIGNRVSLTFELAGTVLGDETMDSRVSVEQLGTDFTGAEFGGACLATGATCSRDASCDAVTPGDVCVPLDGRSEASLEGDTTIIEVDVAIALVEPLTLHLEFNSFDRDLDGRISRDLDGDGVFEDPDGDTIPGSVTQWDQKLDTVTALFDYRPFRKAGVRAGFRKIDRSLERDGFGGVRDSDFDSDGDETLVLSLDIKPTKWLSLNADYENGEVDRAFTAASYFEREQTRLRAIFRRGENLRVDLGFRDWQNENLSDNFRSAATTIDYESQLDGASWSSSLWHRPNEHINYTLRYVEQDLDTSTGILFDTAGFFGVAPGTSAFVNDNTQLSAQINCAWGAWKGHLRFWDIESDGSNNVIDEVNPLAPVVINSERIDQTYDDLELGVTYEFPSGVWVGGAVRDFEYDDQNNLLDYSGAHILVRGGLRF